MRLEPRTLLFFLFCGDSFHSLIGTIGDDGECFMIMRWEQGRFLSYHNGVKLEHTNIAHPRKGVNLHFVKISNLVLMKLGVLMIHGSSWNIL